MRIGSNHTLKKCDIHTPFGFSVVETYRTDAVVIVVVARLSVCSEQQRQWDVPEIKRDVRE